MTAGSALVARGAQWVRGVYCSVREVETSLALFRIGIAASVMFKAALYYPYLDLIYGAYGIVQRPIAQVLARGYIPTTFTLSQTLVMWGLVGAPVLETIYFANIVAALLLMIGFRTRLAAAVCWLTNAVLLSTANVYAYGMDDFQLMGLFYCVFFPVGLAWSLDRRISNAEAPAPADPLPIWVLRAHVCLVYVSAGVWKASGEGWWNGDSIWLALVQPMLIQPPFSLISLNALAKFAPLFMIGGLGVVIAQMSFPVLVSFRRTRTLAVGLMVMLHLGIAAFLGLYLFSFVLIVYDLCAFGGVSGLVKLAGRIKRAVSLSLSLPRPASA